MGEFIMFNKHTDFEIAAVSSVMAIAADVYWLVNDVIHAGRFDHYLTAIGLVSAGVIMGVAWYKHARTGKKPVQGIEDIDYRIALALAKKGFSDHVCRERAIRHRRSH
jgi:hypothetical protein